MIPRLNWKGDDVFRSVIAAARTGIDQTTAAAVVHAKAIHPWRNVTGTAEGSIQMRPARVVRNMIVTGQFGSYGVIYFFWLELGTIKMIAMPCLRPALDVEGPKLTERIKAALEAQ